MDLHLKDKVVVVTGGGTGIGRAIAEAFLREGAKVAVFGRREQPLADFLAGAEASGGTAYIEVLDVTDRAGVAAFADRVKEKLGEIDVWVNNAGSDIHNRFLEYTEEEYDAIVDLNLKSLFFAAQVAGRHMKGRGGVILNISSFAVGMPHANGVVYAATKAAVASITRSTAAALAPHGIRVVGIRPGMILTPLAAEQIKGEEDKYLQFIASKRFGTPEDIADPCVFLASDRASYVTGVDVEINGGKFAVQDCDLAWRLEASE